MAAVHDDFGRIVAVLTHFGGINIPAEVERDAATLLYEQAEMLDTRRWSEFIELFSPDGRYWMPATAEQSTWIGLPSIFSEDRDLMSLRCKRLEHPRAWSLAAPWGTSHQIANIRVLDWNAQQGFLRICSRFSVVERRRDDIRQYAGRYTHDFVSISGSLLIQLQRVDLLAPDQSFDYVFQAWL